MESGKECRGKRRRSTGAEQSFEKLETRLALAAVSWDGGGNGTSWEDPLNWSGNALPAAADDVTLDVPINPSITLNSGLRSIRSLVLAEALTVSGGTLAVQTTAAVASLLTINGGTLSGGTWDLTGGFLRAGASTASTLNGLTVSGEIQLPGGANLRISGGITLSAASAIRLSGTGSNSLGFVGSTTLAAGTIRLENASGVGFVGAVGTGVLTIGPAATISGGRGVVGQNVFSAGNSGLINQGSILSDITGATITVNTSGAGAFSNTGSLTGSGGGLLAVSPATWSSAGTIAVLSGSTVTLSGAWSNTGTLNIDDGTLLLGGSFSRASLVGVSRTGGTLSLTGTLNNAGGTLTVSATTGSLTLAGGTISGGTVAFTGGSTLVATTNNMSTLNSVTIQGDVILGTNANLRLAGSVGLAAGSALRLAGAGGNTLGFVPGATLASGEIVCEAVGGVSIIGVTTGGVFTIAAGATIRGGAATIGSVVFGGSGAVGFTNLGMIRAENPLAELKIAPAGGAFSNTGTAEAAAGARLEISGSVSNYSAQTLTGGTWRSLTGSTLVFGPGPITTNSASIYLGGTGVFAALSALGTTNGALTLADGRDFDFVPAGGTFLVGVNGSLIKSGSGSATIPAGITLDNRGIVSVAGGTLVIAGPVAQVIGLNLSGGEWRVLDAAALSIPAATIRTIDARVILAGSASFPAIASVGTLRGSLTLADGYTFGFTPVAGVLTIESNGNLIKSGTGTTTLPPGVTLNNQGTVKVTGGVLSLVGPVTQRVGSALTGGGWVVSGTGELVIPGAITTNAGSVTLDGPGAVFGAIGTLAVNQGTLTLLGARQWTMTTLTNSGTVNIGGVSGLTLTGPLMNTGLITVSDGTLRAVGGGTSSGEVAVATRGFAEFAGDHQFVTAAKLSGPGSVSFTAGATTWAGTLAVSGTLTLEGGTLWVTMPVSPPGRVAILSGVLRMDAASTFARAEIDGGTVEGIGQLTITNRLDWIGGGFSGSGKLVIASGATLAINGASPLNLDRPLDNAGAVSWLAGSFKQITGTITNLAGATFTLSNSGKWGEGGAPPILINNGTLVKTGAAAVAVSATLTNTGLVRVDGGVLQLAGGGMHTGDFQVVSGARLYFAGGHALAAGSDVTGAGAVGLGAGSFITAGAYSVSGGLSVVAGTASFQGSFTAGAVSVSAGSVTLSTNSSAVSWMNGGELVLGSKTLTLSGAYTQTAGGALRIRMDGRQAGQFGRITAGGAISLSGTLIVSWGTGYFPGDATAFDFLTGSARTGTFSTTTIQSLGLYRVFAVNYLATGVRLWVYAYGVDGT